MSMKNRMTSISDFPGVHHQLGPDEQQVLTLETLYRVIEAIPAGVYIVDKDGKIVYGNTAGKNIWQGIRYVGPSEFHEYKAWWYDSGKEISPDEWAVGRAVHKGETSIDEELRIRCFDGSEKVILNSAIPLFDDKKNIIGAIATNRDITRQKTNEEAIRRNEQRFRRTLDHLLEGIQIIDFEGRYLYVNHSAVQQSKRPREEVIGRSYLDVWPGIDTTETYQCIRNCMEKRTPGQLEDKFVYPTGETGWFELSIQPVDDGVLIMTLDNTFRRQAESRLSQHQRLESLGYLAGGIAHDFNNLFGGIYGNIDLAIGESSESSVIQLLERSLDTIDRAKTLTQQLITFSNGGTPNLKEGHLFPHLEQVIREQVSAHDITLQFDIADDMASVYFDRSQISQSVESVIQNSLEAMQYRGRIKISAGNCFEQCPLMLPPEKKYVRLSVQDSGPGIAEKHIEQVFDPFFTTREHGRGLGLSTCYSIFQRHGGGIEISCSADRGTVVNMFLPAFDSETLTENSTSRQLHQGAGRILIMDDDETVRLVTATMLKKFGYSVTATKEGEAAFKAFEKNMGTSDAYRAVILDLTVHGGWGGVETLSHIRKLDTHTPVFVASGYTDVPIMNNPEDFGFNGSISKPYRVDEMAELLETCLSANPTEAPHS